jgi:hypothetical protein
VNQPVTLVPSIVLAIGKLDGDVRRAADLVLVPRDEHAVLRAHEIGLDDVRAHLDREGVGLDRVLGAVPARAAVRDDDRRGGRVHEPHAERHRGRRSQPATGHDITDDASDAAVRLSIDTSARLDVRRAVMRLMIAGPDERARRMLPKW